MNVAQLIKELQDYCPEELRDKVDVEVRISSSGVTYSSMSVYPEPDSYDEPVEKIQICPYF